MLGLVLEGGANRTYYSIGILDAFLDNCIEADLLVGVSAGIANGVSYISGQRGRCLELGRKYINDKRYMGFRYYFKKGNKSYYNRDFVFREIPESLLPFDYDTFNASTCETYAVVTNLQTGLAEYHRVESNDKSWSLLQASCALPIMFSPIEINGKKYMDGGCADPLPVRFAFDKGCDKVISILTRERTYSKQTETDVAVSSFLFRRHKEFSNALKSRSEVYNNSRAFLFEKEREGSAFVFCPQDTSDWKRTEKGSQVLEHIYNQGYDDAIRRMSELKTFINS